MKFLAFVTPPPDIYHDFFTRKTFWEYNFIPVNMTSCGRRNIRKHREINNSKRYIILDISSKIGCMEKSKFTSSQSRDYMGIPGKGMTTYMDLRTKGKKKANGKVFHY